MAQCIANCRVPKITVNLTGAVGDDNYTLCGPSFGPRFYMMWPRAILRKSPRLPPQPIPAQQVGQPTPSTEQKPDDAKKKRRPKLSEYEFSPESAQYAASRQSCDGIILPSQTRHVLNQLLDIVMRSHVPIRTVNAVRRAAGLPLHHAYGSMRF